MFSAVYLGLLLVGACATGFAQHRILASATADIGGASIFVLALIGFSIACLGLLLMIRGVGFRESWAAPLLEADDRPDARSGVAGERDGFQEINPMLLWDAGFGGRMAMTTYLMLRAQQQAARRHPPRPPRSSVPMVTDLKLQHERC